MHLLFSSCTDLVDMQQEYIETGPNDIFIGRERGNHRIKQFRRKKNLYPISLSSSLPLHSLWKN